MSPVSKKRKTASERATATTTKPTTTTTSSSSRNNSVKGTTDTVAATTTTTKSDVLTSFEPISLEDIRTKLTDLCERIPDIPKELFAAVAAGNDTTTTTTNNGNLLEEEETLMKDWATQLQAVLEEFNLLVCCVATAAYRWGTERSGAADQNLNLLSGELASSQEQIASAVTPRLTNVLAPVVDLVIEKTITTKPDSQTEIRENHFTRKVVDPDFVRLCYRILARNAPLLRHVVLANFHKLLHALKDYLHAQKTDSQTDRGFAY